MGKKSTFGEKVFFFVMVTCLLLLSAGQKELFAAEISGIITNHGGNSVCVSAVPKTGDTNCDLDWENSIGTGADSSTGMYTIPDVPVGDYVLYFDAVCSDENSLLMEEYWTVDNLGTNFCDFAEPFNPNINTDPKNITLEAGVRITGTLANNNSEVINITALKQSGATSCDLDWEHSFGINSNTDGTYSIKVVDDGEYFLYFNPETGEPPYTTFLMEERWTSDGQGTYDCALAESFDPSTDTDPKNTVLDVGARIEGTLSGTDDQEVCVNVQKLRDGGQNGCDSDWVAGGSTGTGGTFSFVAPEGTYYLNAHPDCFGSNANNLIFEHWTSDGSGSWDCNEGETFPVTAGVKTTGIDMAMESGGFISGTITYEEAPNNWDDLVTRVYADNDRWVASGSVISSDATTGTYTTSLMPTGDFSIEFLDEGGQFQEEIYDKVALWAGSDATLVTVTSDTTTPDINADLKLQNDKRYYPGWTAITTTNKYYNTSGTTSTYSAAYFMLNRFSNGESVFRANMESSMTITTPSGTCTDDSYEVDFIWRLNEHDDNNNGLIDENEMRDPQASSYVNRKCKLGDSEHEAGDYTFNLTLPDGSTTITKTLTGVPAGYTPGLFPPVTNLQAFWNNTDKKLDLSWDLGTTYPPDSQIQIRIYLYKNGQYVNNQIRINSVLNTRTTFTFDSDQTVFFDNGNVDQLEVQVRVREDKYWHTNTITYQSYSFDHQAGTITAAPIAMTLLDVDGDKKTGLAEAIYSLKAVSSSN